MQVTGLPPIAAPDSRILILGTMPGARSLESGEYYAHPGNQFRRLLCGVLGEAVPSSFEAFVAVLRKHRIALWNVVASCERVGSADSRIRNPIPNDIPGFLESHPRIAYVFFESRTAEKWHDRIFERKEGLAYWTLPSASGLYARMSFDEKLRVWSENLKVVQVGDSH